jgi:hypothetical protein
MSMRRTVPLLGFILTSTALAVNVPTSKYDNGRSGLNLTETILTLQNVRSNTFGKLFERGVSGDMYPQPLIVESLNIGGGTHNVVFLATANNNVYAYDADDSTRTTPYWSLNLGTPVPATDVDCCCTDIAQNVGIIGTPAIDTGTRTMYLVAKNKNGDGTYHQWLHALDLLTGAEKFGGPVEITATYPGTGAGSVNGVLTFDAKIQNQRAGLLLQGGRLFITWASHNDCGNYHGWVIAYDPATLARVSTWMTTPSGAKGGNWMSGGGLVGDAAHVYFTTGNGDSDVGSGGGNNYGQCFVGLNNDLTVYSWFQSGYYNTLNTGDKDLGGCGVQLIPGTRLLVSGGKEGKLYLVNADTMGGYGGNRRDSCLQAFTVSSGHFHSGPVTFNSPVGTLTYVCAEGDALKAFKLVNGLYQTTPFWTGFAAPNGMPGAQSVVSANGTGNGIVWSTIPFSADANHATVPGMLRASDATTGQEIYNSYQNQARDDLGNFAKNPAPVVSNGKVYVPSFSGKLVVYGLLGSVPPPPPPPPPGNGDGLTGNYFNNVTFTAPAALTRIDPTVNFNWGQTAPDPAVSRNGFTVRWTGFVQPLYSEAYTFYTKTDDGVRLYVNGSLLIDHFVDQPATEWSGGIGLTAGTKYAITMEYYDNTGNASAILSWSSSSTPKAVIPQTQLYSH